MWAKFWLQDGATRHGQASRELLNNLGIYHLPCIDITCHAPLSYVYLWIYHGTLYSYELIFVISLHLWWLCPCHALGKVQSSGTLRTECSASYFGYPMLTRARLQSNIMELENFKSKYLEALEDPDIIDRYHLIFEPIFETLMLPVTKKLQATIDSMAQSISTLKKEAAEKENTIKMLKTEVAHLKSIVEDLEQHGRKDSVRIFGFSETTSGTTDQKVLDLCNNRMKLSPPL